MGTQQLLILLLSVIIVGLTIYMSYNLIHNYLQTSNREELITVLNTLCISAQQYYKKPKEHGGGGGSFLGWTLPKQYQNYESGEIRVVVRDDKVNFNALGTQTGLDDENKVSVDAIVDSKKIRLLVVN